MLEFSTFLYRFLSFIRVESASETTTELLNDNSVRKGVLADSPPIDCTPHYCLSFSLTDVRLIVGPNTNNNKTDIGPTAGRDPWSIAQLGESLARLAVNLRCGCDTETPPEQRKEQ